jgi:hypothetical protein
LQDFHVLRSEHHQFDQQWALLVQDFHTADQSGSDQISDGCPVIVEPTADQTGGVQISEDGSGSDHHQFDQP